MNASVKNYTYLNADTDIIYYCTYVHSRLPAGTTIFINYIVVELNAIIRTNIAKRGSLKIIYFIQFTYHFLIFYASPGFNFESRSLETQIFFFLFSCFYSVTRLFIYLLTFNFIFLMFHFKFRSKSFLYFIL